MVQQQSNTGLGEIISTGIDGEIVSSSGASRNKHNDQFVETPLPFYYLFYATDKPFSLSIRGRKIRCNKNEAIFIKKSVPFSILLTWEGHGLERKDIYAAKFTTKNISDFNFYYSSNFERLKKMELSSHPVPDYIFYNFGEVDEEEKVTLRWMLLQMMSSNNSHRDQDTIQNSCREVKCHFILNHLLKYNHNIAFIYDSCSVTSISEKVAILVMKDYSVNWSIDDLSRVFLMSSSSLKKKMYEDVGSVTDFIQKIKMTEALRRLRRTNDSISLISESLGYCSSSYFSLSFKKYFNMHPSDVRKKSKQS